MTPARTALHVSPHPDDEILGCGATLTILRDRGWRVVNLACSLGRPADAGRRRRELDAALSVLRFESLVADPPERLGAGDDPAAAEGRLAALVAAVADRLGAALVVSPDPGDAHHAHAAVGRAVGRAAGGRRWWSWSLWRDIGTPTLYVPWDRDRLSELEAALACHTGEIRRNPYGDVLAARGRVNAVLGAERVFGFGSGPASGEPYADLLCERAAGPGGEWVPGRPRVLGPEAE